MRYSTQLFNTKEASVLIPVFSQSSGKKGEEANVRRMNGFYSELKSAIFFYTGSPDFPEGGRYFAKATVSEEGDDITVRVVMRLRAGGRTVSSRTVAHTWRDGTVIEKRMDGGTV